MTTKMPAVNVNNDANQMEDFATVAWPYFLEVREKKEDDFAKQQHFYSKYAESYDQWRIDEQYSGPKIITGKIVELYPNQKDIKILDYGCGTGPTAEHLSEHGYTNIDGLDPCKEVIDVSRSKGKMKNFYNLQSDEDDSIIPSSEYDVVCSSGVLFVSASHPGYECIPKILRYVKPGGYVILCHRRIDTFIENRHVTDTKMLDDMVKQGKLRIEPNKVFENWRKPVNSLEGEEPIKGELLVCQVL